MAVSTRWMLVQLDSLGQLLSFHHPTCSAVVRPRLGRLVQKTGYRAGAKRLGTGRMRSPVHTSDMYDAMSSEVLCMIHDERWT